MTDWTDDRIRARFARLSVWQKAGVRAPHKPLLALYALGRVARGAPRLMRFGEIEAEVNGLIDEFGPQRSRPSAHYPFWHLHSDGIWALPGRAAIVESGLTRSGAPRVAVLRAAQGGFPAGLHARLSANGALLVELVELLIAGHFPASYRADIRARIGLLADRWHAEIVGALGAQVGRAYRFALGRPRDPGFRRQLLDAWGGACAVCGFDGAFHGRPFGVEAAHIQWHAAQGPDAIENGLLLCALHHRALDRGVIGLEPDARIKVSPAVEGNAVVEARIGRFHGERLAAPAGGERPAPQFVEWHDRQVFRARKPAAR